VNSDELDPHRRNIRENVRAFLLTATSKELGQELRLSINMADEFRAAVVRELIEERLAEMPLPPNPSKPTKEELVKAVRDYAIAHYEQDGWDYIVETYTDAELAEEIGQAHTVKGAIAKVRRTARLLDERRRDIESTAW
jgi:hypothetical protein